VISTVAIISAMRQVGLLKVGQTPSTDETADLLPILNLMLDSWSCERLDVLYSGVGGYTLTIGVPNYTIGPGGSLTGGVRPVRIDNATIKMATPGGTGFQVFNLKLVTRDEWVAIKDKGASSLIAQVLYYDRAFPLGNINIWPTPTAALTLTLYTWIPLAQFPDLVTDVPLAPGYGRAITLGLALELCTRFDIAISQSLQQQADSAMNAIRTLNAEQKEPQPNTPAAAEAEAITKGAKQ
jgi:hypothetical protein